MNITNIDDIRKLASGDEGGRTEYKLITGQLERGMETLCAFLNGEGGTVLFGVADNGKITGQAMTCLSVSGMFAYETVIVANGSNRRMASAISRFVLSLTS